MTALLRQLAIAAGVVLAAVVLAAAVNAVRPDGLAWVQDWDKTMEERAKAEGANEVEVIDLAQMREVKTKPGVVVVDARPSDFYEMAHIPGARSLPLAEAPERLSGFLDGLPRDAELVVYCDGPSCPAARELAEKIVQAGLAKVKVFIGGWEEWSMEGLPEESGPEGGA